MASMTSRPVASGRVTSARSTIAGAGCSTGKNRSVSSASPPSSGTPSASTTRPSNASPTGTRATSPVPRTILPAEISAASRQAARSQSSSSPRSTARPRTPPVKRPATRRGVFRQALHGGHAVAEPEPPGRSVPDPRLQGQACLDGPAALAKPIVQIVSERWHGRRVPSAGRKRALPGKAQNGRWETQLRASESCGFTSKATAMPVPSGRRRRFRHAPAADTENAVLP